MGLNIYLYKYENFEDTQKRESEYEKESHKNWDFNGRSYNDLSEDEKKEASDKDKILSERLGLDEYGSDKKAKVKIETNSSLYPDHYFKIGYFRSSYNASGMERILSNLNIPGLHDIFKVDGEYEFQPNWNDSLIRVNGSIELIKNLIDRGDNFRCVKFNWNEFNGDPNDYQVDSEQKALEVFLKEKNNKHGGGDYSNSNGTFYFDEPLKVSGVIMGVNKRFFVGEKLPCNYLIFKDDELNWYLQALEIVKETIEFILSKSDINKYYLHWSS